MSATPYIAAEFGPLIVETDVDAAVIRTLRTWLPTYLAQVERERDLTIGTLARPVAESYANTLEDDEFMDHRMPAIIVTTAEPENNAQRDGNGLYRASWTVRVSSVVRGRTPRETRAVAAVFGGSVRRVLVQHADLDDFSAGLRWIGSNVIRVEDTTDQGRYLAASINLFNVFVEDVLRDGVGPTVPSDPYDPPDLENPNEPYEPWVTVGEITTNIIGVTEEPGS
jgi:hypothetical protein